MQQEQVEPHEVRASAHAPRRADIQGLRAVAVLLVVAFHAGVPVHGGFIGVDMFFVISGFVIAGMLVRQLDETSRISLVGFYTRRMRRLLPALALLTTVVTVASMLLLGPLGPQQATGRTGIAASIFGANIQLGRVPHGGYFDLAADINALLHTWSLSVEEQFYLVFPALLILAWYVAKRYGRDRSRRRTTAAFVAAATTGSFALSMLTTYHPSARLGTSFAFYSAGSRAWEFGVGVLLALAAPALGRIGERVALGAGLGGVALIAVGAFRLSSTTAFPGFASLLPVAGTALLLIAGAVTQRGVATLLRARPAVWIGDVSYGWYLWHWPLIVFAAALWPGSSWLLVAAAIVALVPTWLSYRFVERPIRFNDRLTGTRMVPLVLACMLIPIVASASLLYVNRRENRTPTVKAFATATALHADRQRGCDQQLSIGARTNAARCTWSVSQPRGTAYLVGDSNAGQFTEPAAAAVNHAGYDLTVATSAGCPFVEMQRVTTAATFDGTTCERNVTRSVADLVKRRPALVIIAMSSTEYVEDPAEALRDPHTGEVARDPTAKAALWQRGLGAVVAALDDAGIPTLVLHTIPQLGSGLGDGWTAAECPTVRIDAHECGGTAGRATVAAAHRPARDAEDRAVAGHRLATAVDFFDGLCPNDPCRANRGSLLMYRDVTHLSIGGALTLTGRFQELVDAHARRPDAIASP